jgi:hypothetical protein
MVLLPFQFTVYHMHGREKLRQDGKRRSKARKVLLVPSDSRRVLTMLKTFQPPSPGANTCSI